MKKLFFILLALALLPAAHALTIEENFNTDTTGNYYTNNATWNSAGNVTLASAQSPYTSSWLLHQGDTYVKGTNISAEFTYISNLGSDDWANVGLYMNESTSANRISGYGCGIRQAGTDTIQGVNHLVALVGSSDALDETAEGNRYRLVTQYDSSNNLKCKVWKYDEDEPSGWNVSTTYSAARNRDGNAFGVYTDAQAHIDVHFFGYNTTNWPTVSSNPFLDITIQDIFDDANLEGLTVTLADGTSNTTDASGNAHFENKTTQSFNVTDSGNLYFDYNSSSDPTENDTTTYQIWGSTVYIGDVTTIQGRSTDYPYNLTINGTTTQINTSGQFAYGKPQADHSVHIGKAGFYNTTSSTQAFSGKSTPNLTTSSLANTVLNFLGDVSGINYAPVCTYNATTLSSSNNQYDFAVDAGTVSCDEDTAYDDFNFNLALTNVTPLQPFPAVQNITVVEWKLSLNFDANTTGKIYWTHDSNTSERGQFPLESDEAYNLTSFEFIKAKTNWTEDTRITVFFNPAISANETGQYYEYLNEINTVTNENVTVLNNLDRTLWVKVYNFGQEELLDASITVYHCPDSAAANCELVTRRLSTFVGGASYDGVPIYLDQDLEYWIVVSKTGFDTETLVLRGLDTLDDEGITFTLKPTLANYQEPFTVMGVNYHSNETSQNFIVSSIEGGNYYYNTSYRSALTPNAFTQGGDLLTLTAGTDFALSTNYTVYFHTYNSSSASYDLEFSKFVQYRATESRNLLGGIGNNTVLNFVFWIVLLILASIAGSFIRSEDKDTGFWAFSVGAIALGFISSFYIPVAIVLLLMGGASLAFSASRE